MHFRALILKTCICSCFIMHLLRTASNMAATEEREEEEEEEDENEEEKQEEEERDESDESKRGIVQLESSSSAPVCETLQLKKSAAIPRRHRKQKSETSTLQSAPITNLGTKRDNSENHLFGKFVARSLDGMSNEQKFAACSKIHDILFHVKNGSQFRHIHSTHSHSMPSCSTCNK